MLSIRINTRLCVKNSPVFLSLQRSESVVSSNLNEIVQPTPEYPPIQDISFKERHRRYQEEWAQKIQNIKTVEEKAIKVNMPRYWGFKCLIYEEGAVYYNEIPQAKFITRTHLASRSGLPSYYDNIIPEEKFNNLVKKVKNLFENSIMFELQDVKRNYEKPIEIMNIQKNIDDVIGDAVSRQVNRIMIGSLVDEYPHLLGTQVDLAPRIEAFWFTGGMNKSRFTKSAMKYRYFDEIMDEPINKPMQYIGHPSLQLRYKLPLREILSMEECQNPDWDIPLFPYDPRTTGHHMKRRHGTTIPGVWPGDSCEFGLMSYHKRGYLHTRPVTDDLDALITQAIYANYGWLLGQANLLGFTTFNDITYPLVNQSITTNGQFWSFCVYQLNTTLLHYWHSQKNPKKNVCWMTEPIKLYEKIENGKFVGLNDEVLKNLIKFYINVPQERIGVDLRPYLDSNVPRIGDIEDEERRNWLESEYKRIMSNRPRHRLMPEMYHWEWIYKHMFKTRPRDRKSTPWDYGINPFLRRMDQTSPVYVPKKFRQHKRKKDKFAKTYFP